MNEAERELQEEVKKIVDAINRIGDRVTVLEQQRPSEPGGVKAVGSKEFVMPRIVCLCGSTRFMEAFQRVNLEQTLAGRIVLSVGCNTKSDADLTQAGELTEELKRKLDNLHLRKIDLADEILVLNVGGYIGESTRREIEYARATGKTIGWLETPEAQRPN
jgi:hypothetical protein